MGTTPNTVKIMYSEPGMPEMYWTLKRIDAKKSIELDSTVADALKGVCGSTIGCHLSACADRNKKKFPHDYIMAAFTQSMCYVITKFYKRKKKVNGTWCDGECVRYEHRMRKWVDLNDEDTDKVVIKTWPELAEMEFSLYAPYTNRNRVRPPREGVAPRGKKPGERAPTLMRGALQRAVRAGLVSKPVAAHLENMVSE